MDHLLLVSMFIWIAIPSINMAPPTKRQQAGPCVGMDCMHGVLMHGDSDHGDSHTKEDEFKAKQEALDAINRDKEPVGPCQGMDCMHGVLMHGDQQGDTAHMHQQIGPEKAKGKAGPGEGMDFLHGVMMHGDERPGRDHQEEHRQLTKPPGGDGERGADGPCVGMDCLHGVLMHSDDAAGGDHAQEHEHDREKLLEKSGRKFSSPDLESAMHGGAKDGHDHVHSSENKAPVLEKHKGVPSISDPHEAIHGHLRGQIKLDTSENTEDKDYLEWLKANKNKNKEESAGLLGFSFPFISDSLLDNIEILKRRYLPKFWGGSDVKKGQQEQVAPAGEAAEEETGAHELLSDLGMVGDTAPHSAHHQHGHRPGKGDKEGSGRKHDEG